MKHFLIRQRLHRGAELPVHCLTKSLAQKTQIATSKNFVPWCAGTTLLQKAAANEISVAAAIVLLLIKSWMTFTEHKNSHGGTFFFSPDGHHWFASLSDGSGQSYVKASHGSCGHWDQ